MTLPEIIAATDGVQVFSLTVSTAGAVDLRSYGYAGSTTLTDPEPQSIAFEASYSNSVYRLDIYHPDQTGTNPISTTRGFNAAKVTVDYWRNVYSLNYEILKRPDKSLPAKGVTEPSISQWIPTPPPPCEAQQALTRQLSKQQQLAVLPSPRRPLRRRDFWRA